MRGARKATHCALRQFLRLLADPVNAQLQDVSTVSFGTSVSRNATYPSLAHVLQELHPVFGTRPNPGRFAAPSTQTSSRAAAKRHDSCAKIAQMLRFNFTKCCALIFGAVARQTGKSRHHPARPRGDRTTKVAFDMPRIGVLQVEKQTDCVPNCVPRIAPVAASERQSDFRAKAKPAELAGFSVKSLVALPGIVSRPPRISYH
jgi:hypothetical protein